MLSPGSPLGKSVKEGGRGGLTAKSPTSNRSLPLESFASGYCFLRDSNKPAPDRKSGMPDAVEMPAPGGGLGGKGQG